MDKRSPIVHHHVRQQILAHVDAHGPTTCDALVQATGIKRNIVSGALSRALQDGVLVRQVRKRGSVYERAEPLSVQGTSKTKWRGQVAGRPYRLLIALERKF